MPAAAQRFAAARKTKVDFLPELPRHEAVSTWRRMGFNIA
jgi:hypothetical protein